MTPSMVVGRTVSRTPLRTVFSPVVVLLTCLGVLTTMQVVALGERNPISDTLSSYVYVSSGWMLGLAFLLLAVGAAGVVRLLRKVTPGRWVARVLFGGAAVSAVSAAVFQADPATATAASATGEIHKWSSVAMLALIPAGILVCVFTGLIDRRYGRSIVLILVTAAVSGGLFLAGQVSKWSIGGSAALADQAPWAGGLTQRILVVSLVCGLVVVAGSLTERKVRAL